MERYGRAGQHGEGVPPCALYQPAAIGHVVSALPIVLPSPCVQAKLQAHRDAEKQLKDKLKEVGLSGGGGRGAAAKEQRHVSSRLRYGIGDPCVGACGSGITRTFVHADCNAP